MLVTPNEDPSLTHSILATQVFISSAGNFNRYRQAGADVVFDQPSIDRASAALTTAFETVACTVPGDAEIVMLSALATYVGTNSSLRIRRNGSSLHKTVASVHSTNAGAVRSFFEQSMDASQQVQIAYSAGATNLAVLETHGFTVRAL